MPDFRAISICCQCMQSKACRCTTAATTCHLARERALHFRTQVVNSVNMPAPSFQSIPLVGQESLSILPNIVLTFMSVFTHCTFAKCELLLRTPACASKSRIWLLVSSLFYYVHYNFAKVLISSAHPQPLKHSCIAEKQATWQRLNGWADPWWACKKMCCVY